MSYHKYRYSINGTSVNPHMKEDVRVTKTYTKPADGYYFREGISSKWVFFGNDVVFINSQSETTVFECLVEHKTVTGFVEFFKGRFTLQDCEFNLDAGYISAEIAPNDVYRKVLESYDKEVNIIPLQPEMKYLTIQKRPLIQVYLKGESYLSCFVGGSTWEQDCTAIDDHDALVNTFKFHFNRRMIEVHVKSDSIPEAMRGTYTGIYTQGFTQLNHTSGLYSLRETSAGYDYFGFVNYNALTLFRNSDSVPFYASAYNVLFGSNPLWDDITSWFLVPVTSYSTTNGVTMVITQANGHRFAVAETSHRYFDIYSRYLLNVGKLGNSATFDLPLTDIASTNLNYRKVLPYLGDITTIEPDSTNSYTKYGLRDDGRYYVPPKTIRAGYAYPIATRSWGKSSLWVNYEAVSVSDERAGRFPTTDKSSYTFASVLNVLLKSIDPTLSHLATPEYSKFLYGTRNPVSNLRFTLLVSQKSNLLHGVNVIPAKKAIVKLKGLLEALASMFKCYWHFEGTKLRIEHTSYYANGRSYEGSPIIGLDLTVRRDPKNGKPYATGFNSFSYDKLDFPYRTTMKFMDKVSTTFEGVSGIIDLSPNANRLVTEDINLDSITTDVDYAQMNPEAIAQDGLMIYAAVNETTQATTLTGYIDENGVYQAGTGWSYAMFEVSPSAMYEIRTTQNVLANNVYVNYFNEAKTHVSRNPLTSGEITTSDKTHHISVSWRNGVTGVPDYLPVSDVKYLYAKQLSLPFVTRDVDGVSLEFQNGYLAFPELARNYYLHDLPVVSVDIEGATFQARSRKKVRKQTVSIPVAGEIDTIKAIKTGLGVGMIEKISLSLSSRLATIDLKV